MQKYRLLFHYRMRHQIPGCLCRHHRSRFRSASGCLRYHRAYNHLSADPSGYKVLPLSQSVSPYPSLNFHNAAYQEAQNKPCAHSVLPSESGSHPPISRFRQSADYLHLLQYRDFLKVHLKSPRYMQMYDKSVPADPASKQCEELLY